MSIKKKAKLTFILLGIGCFIIGLIFNLPSTDVGRTETTINLNPGDHSIEVLTSNLNPKEYGLNIQLYGSLYFTSNTTILVINSTEYQRYGEGVHPANLTAFLEITGNYVPASEQLNFQKTFTISTFEFIAIVIINHETSQIHGYVSNIYSITTPIYFLGVIMMIIGCIVSLSAGACYFIGWKRYFIIGVEVSTIFFLIRIGIFPILPENFNMLSILNLFDIEIYRDFEYYYCLWAELFREGHWLFSGIYGGYSYGPLFMLALGVFSFIPIPLWSIAIPLLISTIGTGFLVYKIAKKITKNDNYGIIAMLLYFLNPFTLLYGSFGWLNPPLFVFFILLTFYLILQQKYGWAILSLGISTMFKQFAIIFFPIILILILRTKKNSKLSGQFKDLFIYAFEYFGIIFIISLPFLIVNFNIYIQKFLLGGADISFDYLTTLYRSPGAMVHFNTFFLLIGAPDIITNVIAFLLKYYILFGACLLGINLFLLLYSPKEADKSYKNELYKLSLFLSIFIIFAFQIFYPRGSFKYYLILLAPFISILFGAKIKEESKESFSFKLINLVPTVISWIIFFFNRFLYFWIIIAWMMGYIIILYQALKNHGSFPI